MDTVLCVGLGNPGNRFIKTRHNVGIRALQEWVRGKGTAGAQVSLWKKDEKAQAEIAEVVLHDHMRAYALFPLTFMNRAGEAVRAFLRNRPIPPDNILIIHDELELPFGVIKEKNGGSASGHNGVRSIHEALGTQDIRRLRIGIGRPKEGEAIDGYVLRTFSPQEEEALPQVLLEAGKYIESFSGSLIQE